MKVCHLTSVHRSQDTRILKKECISLAKHGYEVYLVAKGKSYIEDNVKVIGIGDISGNRIIRMIKVTRQIYKVALSVECDIYHIHDPELLPYCLKLKKLGKKVIFDSHESYSDTILEKKYLPKITRKFISFIFKKYFKYVAKRIDSVICCYHQTKESLEKHNTHTPLVFNFPIVNESKFEYTKGNKICYAGGLMEQWNHHIVSDAINDSNVKYIIAGKKTPYIDNLILNNSNINYIGFMPFDEIYELYKNSQIGICILDYIKQCNGNTGNLSNTKFFEYLMAGLPIICTDFTLWKQIIDEYNCGICVNPNNTQEVRGAIMYLLNNYEIAKSMGENGRRAALEKYNWSTQEKILINLYKELEVNNCEI